MSGKYLMISEGNSMIKGDSILDPHDEWRGMPEFEHQDQTSYRKIIVHFKTAGDVEWFSRLIGQNLGKKLKSIWFPKAEIERYADKAYVDA
jgi:hypothetical protein